MSVRSLPLPALAGTLAVLLALLIAACGGADDADEAPPSADLGLEHVHGLGVNPADDALYIATHYGLFRSEGGTSTAERVGAGLQDTMGFTVIGPDRFLASGHPGPGEEGPSNLGLIESTDGGETWEEVSLGGEADFHALVWAHDRVYGYDATAGRLMLSDDEGRTWEELSAPAPVIDLAVDPEDPDRIVLSTQAGLLVSEDGGGRWESAGAGGRTGLVAWPAAQRLFLVDAGGLVYVSRDGGARWDEVGEIGAPPAALVAESGRELYAALPEGEVLRSPDGGGSWNLRTQP